LGAHAILIIGFGYDK